MFQWRLRRLKLSLFYCDVTQTLKGVHMVWMTGDELLKYLSSHLKVAAGAVCIAPKIINVLDCGIQLGRPIKVSSGGSPLAFTVIGIRTCVNVGGFLSVQLDCLCVFRNGSVPVTRARVFPGQQKMVISFFWFSVDCVPEFLDGVWMIVASAGHESQAEMSFGRPWIQIRSLSQVSCRFFVSIEIEQRNSEIVEHLESARGQFVDATKQAGCAFVLFTF